MKNHSKKLFSGIQFMLLSAIAFSGMALCVKYAATDIHPLQIVFVRSFFGMLILLGIMRAKQISVWGAERKILTLRGFFGFIALLLHFYTIAHLDIGTAVMLSYTFPIFVALFSSVFLGEKPAPHLLGLILLSFVGIICLNSRYGFHWNTYLWLALLSAIFAAAAYTTIRAIKHKESPITVIFYFTFVATLGSLIFIPLWSLPGQSITWFWLTGVVMTSFFGQLWLTMGLRRTPAYLATPFSYLNPVLAFFYGWLLWDVLLTPLSLFGVFLIILSGCLLSYFGTRKTPPIKN